MKTIIRDLFVVIALVLIVIPVVLSDISIQRTESVLAIPCNSERENCTAHFHSMLKYLRTFTLRYKIYKVTKKDNLKTILIKFMDGNQCRKFLTMEYEDLKSLDATLEKNIIDDKEYWMLYNLNHRLIMACIG